MYTIHLESVLSPARGRVLVCLVLVFFAWPANGQSLFSGPYLGVDVGRQHVIGGSLVDDIDTLQEDTRTVVSLLGGMRGQFHGFVAGGELGFGRLDGGLLLEDPSRQLTVDYASSSQWQWALNAGHLVGARTLVFGYVAEVSRDFEVTITQAGRVFNQQDAQGLLRFGAGVEHRFAGPWSLRATVGTSRADFGTRTTNIAIDKRRDASVGVVLQF